MKQPENSSAGGASFPGSTVRRFRAGDHVKHAPTGEEWELACDEERGEVMPSGWPMCIAKAEHCTLIEAATDERRTEVLKQWAAEGKGYEHERDWRTIMARRQISSANSDYPTAVRVSETPDPVSGSETKL